MKAENVRKLEAEVARLKAIVDQPRAVEGMLHREIARLRDAIEKHRVAVGAGDACDEHLWAALDGEEGR